MSALTMPAAAVLEPHAKPGAGPGPDPTLSGDVPAQARHPHAYIPQAFIPQASLPRSFLPQAREPVADYDGVGPVWQANSQALRRCLTQPRVERPPARYVRGFVDRYRPNHSSLLPPALAEELTELSRIPDQHPAGTYLCRVLEPLLIDLSWSSSYLEGSRYTRMDTEKLFQCVQDTGDPDATMLLNHKRAIEFMAEAVPREGLRPALLRNVHGLLMDGLLADPRSLGAVRQKRVLVSGTTYVPCQVPSVLSEMFKLIVDKAAAIGNPVEAAFFLWVQLAYLQCFEDGNKRLSRLAANVPLILYNQAPLSFMDVTREDYALAMIGVYERQDVSMAVDLFNWTYRRTLPTYRSIMEAMGKPDAFRLKHRRLLESAVGRVVVERQSAAAATYSEAVAPEHRASFLQLLTDELEVLGLHNYARFRLRPEQVSAWAAAGRPQ